jgi:uncharacterized protein (TIGR03790 family)
MNRWRIAILWLALLPAAWAETDEAAARLIILANANDADSLRIARHYAAQRKVPAENIIALPLAATETIGWADFVRTLWQPLQNELVTRGWISAIRMNLTDEAGRIKYAPSGHRISYLVVCRGVPLRIRHEPTLAAAARPMTDKPEFRTNQGAVDSELSLLAAGNYNINAFVRNPLFLSEAPGSFDLEQVVKVTRLDGPAAADVMALIDRTVSAELHGLLGRAYVDVRGPHKQGERWLEAAARQLDELHFDPEVRLQPGTFPVGARFDAPALYFGWYARHVNGPFTLPGFRFAPGAIALHIHSNSADTLRSPTAGWCGPLVARGAAVTCGAVFEPYLELMHHPQLLLRMLARGHRLGDAAYYALPALSWQNIVIGDPLYRPFARSQAEQWADRDTLPASLRPYAALREINRLLAGQQRTEALALAREEMRRQPGLALGVALARLLADEPEPGALVAALGFAAYLKSVRPDEWALWHEAAQLLARHGAPATAVEAYQALFATAKLPAELRQEWLADASQAARQAGDFARSSQWDQEAAALAVRPSAAP